MVSLRHFDHNDWEILKEKYADIPKEEIIEMIDEWNTLNYHGNFFEMFAVISEGQVVGTVSIYAKGDEIEAGPMIFCDCRKKGYGFEAVKAALEKAKTYGYKAASANIRKDNTPSLCLHQKLGFVFIGDYMGKKGYMIEKFIKEL